jgi:hypothetical protein
MDPDQTARMRRLVWIHAGRKPIMLVLSWHGSNYYFLFSSSKRCNMLMQQFYCHCKIKNEINLNGFRVIKVENMHISRRWLFMAKISHFQKVFDILNYIDESFICERTSKKHLSVYGRIFFCGSKLFDLITAFIIRH